MTENTKSLGKKTWLESNHMTCPLASLMLSRSLPFINLWSGVFLTHKKDNRNRLSAIVIYILANCGRIEGICGRPSHSLFFFSFSTGMLTITDFINILNRYYKSPMVGHTCTHRHPPTHTHHQHLYYHHKVRAFDTKT